MRILNYPDKTGTITFTKFIRAFFIDSGVFLLIAIYFIATIPELELIKKIGILLFITIQFVIIEYGTWLLAKYQAQQIVVTKNKLVLIFVYLVLLAVIVYDNWSF